MSDFTSQQVKKINKTALAAKYDCSPEYVSQILRGIKDANTEKAKAIISDAEKLLFVLEKKTYV